MNPDHEPDAALPRVFARAQHQLPTAQISAGALQVLQRLQEAGYQAFLVGGGVRDLLLDLHPKDFDIATDARPEQIHELFRRSRIIGRRFRLVHVLTGRETIEVSTFRGGAGHSDATTRNAAGRLLRDNAWGNLDEDAQRRDFTVNALYYTPENSSILDYVGGMQDLEDQCLRIIGDAAERYQEDPVRMLRALRLAAKLGFAMEPGTEEPIAQLAHRLEDIPAARLFDELSKLLLTGYAQRCWEALLDSPLLVPLLPGVAEALDPPAQTLLLATMRNTDQRIASGKPVTPGFLTAALLWPAVRQQQEYLEETTTMSPRDCRASAIDAALRRQHQRTSIPRRHSLFARETWEMQANLEQRRNPNRVGAKPRFRAAWDLLQLRTEAGEVEPDQLEFWRPQYQQAGEQRQPRQDRSDFPADEPRRRPRRRRRPRGGPAEQES